MSVEYGHHRRALTSLREEFYVVKRRYADQGKLDPEDQTNLARVITTVHTSLRRVPSLTAKEAKELERDYLGLLRDVGTSFGTHLSTSPFYIAGPQEHRKE